MSKTLKLSKESLSVLDGLTDEQAGRLFKAIKQFNEGIEPEMDTIVRIAFYPFMSFLTQNKKQSEANRLNGMNGGRPRKNRNEANESENNRTKANESEKKRNNPNNRMGFDDEKTELVVSQDNDYDGAVESIENVLETDCDFTTEIQPEKPKKVKKSKNPFTESEIWFLDLFNNIKSQLRDNPRPHKSISETGRRNLQKLLDTGHLQHDFEHAITAMLGADWAKRTGNDTPDHLLREENFLRYLNVQSLKQVQYGSDKPNREEEWADAYDTLKQFYTTEQPSGN